jgi:phage-related tail protein
MLGHDARHSSHGVPMSPKSSLAATSKAATQGRSAVAGRLETARRAVEGRFLQAGEVLGQAVEGIGRLIASLDQLTKAVQPAAVEATTAELQAAAASLLTLPDQHAERRRVVERLTEVRPGDLRSYRAGADPAQCLRRRADRAVHGTWHRPGA